MEEQDYLYELKPLIVPGLMFLILYPIITGAIFKFLNVSQLQMKILTGIYAVTAVSIVAIWIFARSKRVRVDQEKIILHSIFGEKIIRPEDIKRIHFFRLRNGQEMAQIRTKKQSYYLSEFYFPFPELMSDVEIFISNHSIRSNLESI